MKRIFRAAIILIPVTVLLVGISMWRHHYLKTMNAEPEKVYIYTPVDDVPANTTASEVTPGTTEQTADVEVETDIALQRVDKGIAAEKDSNSDGSEGDGMLGEVSEQSALSPDAAAALKEYELAQSGYIDTQKVLQDALDARPIDWDLIRSANDKIKKAAEYRLETLINLAVYLDEASQELADTLAQMDETDRIIANRTAARRREPSPEAMRIFETLEVIPPEEWQKIIEAVPRIKEIMKNRYGYEIPE